MSKKDGTSASPSDSKDTSRDEVEDNSRDVGDVERDSISQASSTQSGYKCDLCAKDFTHEQHLINHEMDHKLTYSMNDPCWKKFIDPIVLKNHSMAVHNQSEPFSCNHCERRFETVRHLEKHMIVRHSNEYDNLSNSSLSQISESFAQTSTRKRSVTTTGDNQSPRKSSRSESSSNPTEDVIQVMIPIQVRKKQPDCYICGAKNCHTGFNTAAELYQHRLYEHDQSFICRYCHCTYKKERTRKFHEKAHVLGAILTPGWERNHSDLPELTELQRNEKVPCMDCNDGSEFKTVASLLDHVHQDHISKMPMFCTCCEVWFPNEERKKLHPCEERRK